jgi:Sep-tRNA:Cys-tRNA synthetase
VNYRYKGMTIINPLMRGGIVPQEVRERLYEEGWTEVGYAVCFDCIEGRSSLITKPGIKSFLGEVAKFFGGDAAEHTFGCRSAQFTAMRTAAQAAKEENRAPIVVADPNSHYTTNIAAEMCDLEVVEPPHSGYPLYQVEAAEVEKKIEEVEKKRGKPALVVMTHADPYYGNVAPVKEVGRLCEEKEIPYLVNAAYTGGVMPIHMKDLKADFLTLSAHKSMASLAPLGFLVTTYEWSQKVFAVSSTRPDWTGRAFGKKIPGLFGCSIGGLPLVSAILSFPYVKERVKRWEEEMERSRRFVKDLEDLGSPGDLMLLGERPHHHHLLHFETPLFWEISKGHKRGGFFLAEEMIRRGIVGLHKGLSKHIKLSVYGLSDEELAKVKGAFEEIARMKG